MIMNRCAAINFSSNFMKHFEISCFPIGLYVVESKGERMIDPEVGEEEGTEVGKDTDEFQIGSW